MVNIKIIGHNISFILALYPIIGKCEIVSHMFGGGLAEIRKFRYVAYLGISFQGGGFACGSSILNKKLLLTAGHCLIKCTKHCHIAVSAGDVHSMEGAISSGRTFIIHRSFVESTFNNDIALIRLKTPFKYGANIGRVALMMSYEPSQNEKAKVAGWGFTCVERPSPKLKYLKQYLKTRKECIETLWSLNENEICAESGQGFPARGDSGGALVIQKHVQVGIVSYRKPDLCEDMTVYTAVTKYITWIRKVWRKKLKN